MTHRNNRYNLGGIIIESAVLQDDDGTTSKNIENEGAYPLQELGFSAWNLSTERLAEAARAGERFGYMSGDGSWHASASVQTGDRFANAAICSSVRPDSIGRALHYYQQAAAASNAKSGADTEQVENGAEGNEAEQHSDGRRAWSTSSYTFAYDAQQTCVLNNFPAAVTHNVLTATNGQCECSSSTNPPPGSGSGGDSADSDADGGSVAPPVSTCLCSNVEAGLPQIIPGNSRTLDKKYGQAKGDALVTYKYELYINSVVGGISTAVFRQSPDTCDGCNTHFVFSPMTGAVGITPQTNGFERFIVAEVKQTVVSAAGSGAESYTNSAAAVETRTEIMASREWVLYARKPDYLHTEPHFPIGSTRTASSATGNKCGCGQTLYYPRGHNNFDGKVECKCGTSIESGGAPFVGDHCDAVEGFNAVKTLTILMAMSSVPTSKSGKALLCAKVISFYQNTLGAKVIALINLEKSKALCTSNYGNGNADGGGGGEDEDGDGDSSSSSSSSNDRKQRTRGRRNEDFEIQLVRVGKAALEDVSGAAAAVEQQEQALKMLIQSEINQNNITITIGDAIIVLEKNSIKAISDGTLYLAEASDSAGNLPPGGGGGDDDGIGPGTIAVATIAALLLVVIGLMALRMNQKPSAFDFSARLQQLIDSGELVLIGDGDGGTGKAGSTRHDPNLPREIKRTCVKLTGKLGSGQFGDVSKGVLDEKLQSLPGGVLVAVKSATSVTSEGAEEICREAAIMAQLTEHQNVLSLIGVVTKGEPLLLLLSFCEHGSLLSLLRWPRASTAPSPLRDKTFFSIALDIANGMKHLSSSFVVHRDLAARNVLVDSLLVCKVADFGLSRGLSHLKSKEGGGGGGGDDGDDDYDDGGEAAAAATYYKAQGSAFPLRWTAPECMSTMKFTTASDMWSFGILLSEVFEDGKTPYTALSNDEVMAKVPAGYRMSKPHACSIAVFQLMERCWATDPKVRPSFKRIVIELKALEVAQLAQNQPALWSMPGSGDGFVMRAIDEIEEVEGGLFEASASGWTVDGGGAGGGAGDVCGECGQAIPLPAALLHRMSWHSVTSSEQQQHRLSSISAAEESFTYVTSNDSEQSREQQALYAQRRSSNALRRSSGAIAPPPHAAAGGGGGGGGGLYLSTAMVALQKQAQAAAPLYTAPRSGGGGGGGGDGGGSDLVMRNDSYADAVLPLAVIHDASTSTSTGTTSAGYYSISAVAAQQQQQRAAGTQALYAVPPAAAQAIREAAPPRPHIHGGGNGDGGGGSAMITTVVEEHELEMEQDLEDVRKTMFVPPTHELPSQPMTPITPGSTSKGYIAVNGVSRFSQLVTMQQSEARARESGSGSESQSGHSVAVAADHGTFRMATLHQNKASWASTISADGPGYELAASGFASASEGGGDEEEDEEAAEEVSAAPAEPQQQVAIGQGRRAIITTAVTPRVKVGVGAGVGGTLNTSMRQAPPIWTPPPAADVGEVGQQQSKDTSGRRSSVV